MNDAFLAALGNAFARYHEKHGAPVERLRAAIAVNTRRAGDSPHGNHVNGGSFVMPVGTDDPAKYLAIYHDAVAVIREDVGQPLAEAVGTAMAAFGPFVSGLMGAILKHCDFAATNVPGINVPLYLGGAEMLAMYGFGPAMGTAVNIAFVCTATTPASGSTPTPPPSLTSMCSSSACARASTPSSLSPSSHADVGSAVGVDRRRGYSVAGTSLGELAYHFGEAAVIGETERAVSYAADRRNRHSTTPRPKKRLRSHGARCTQPHSEMSTTERMMSQWGGSLCCCQHNTRGLSPCLSQALWCSSLIYLATRSLSATATSTPW